MQSAHWPMSRVGEWHNPSLKPEHFCATHHDELASSTAHIRSPTCHPTPPPPPAVCTHARAPPLASVGVVQSAAGMFWPRTSDPWMGIVSISGSLVHITSHTPCDGAQPKWRPRTASPWQRCPRPQAQPVGRQLQGAGHALRRPSPCPPPSSTACRNGAGGSPYRAGLQPRASAERARPPPRGPLGSRRSVPRPRRRSRQPAPAAGCAAARASRMDRLCRQHTQSAGRARSRRMWSVRPPWALRSRRRASPSPQPYLGPPSPAPALGSPPPLPRRPPAATQPQRLRRP
mmetsp:Transcript_72965/g.162098  ORF Transcript_72965/g.162098 Transcript_72965/m.162098 type:complete len:288 (+) Transcript_72965:50-913(+)